MLTFDEWLSFQTSDELAWLINEYGSIKNAYVAYVRKTEGRE